jgi:hypothetical protein
LSLTGPVSEDFYPVNPFLEFEKKLFVRSPHSCAHQQPCDQCKLWKRDNSRACSAVQQANDLEHCPAVHLVNSAAKFKHRIMIVVVADENNWLVINCLILKNVQFLIKKISAVWFKIPTRTQSLRLRFTTQLIGWHVFRVKIIFLRFKNGLCRLLQRWRCT